MSIAVVSGAIANKHLNGGASWTRLSYALGLKKLGFNVYFFEQIQPETCIDGDGAPATLTDSENLAYFKRVMEQFQLCDSSALISTTCKECYGMAYKQLLEVAEAADLLVNITGHLTIDSIKRRIRRKLYVDLDPAFTQFWREAGNTGPHLEEHDFYFTVGENIGTAGCEIPTGDIRWRPTRQPVVLEYWPVSNGGPGRFTTVASWRGAYGPVERHGKTLGVKVHEFRKFADMPLRTGADFEIALDIHPADFKDLFLLQNNGWLIVDPKTAIPDPVAFRNYVQASGAEFSVAQGIYVETRSGWFSDRSVRYLASGKPVVVQDTGFSDNYPVGEGLLSFESIEDAADGVEMVRRDYEKHSRAARKLAEAYFDSSKVLTRMVEEVGVSP